jgi:hypothetical protein
LIFPSNHNFRYSTSPVDKESAKLHRFFSLEISNLGDLASEKVDGLVHIVVDPKLTGVSAYTCQQLFDAGVGESCMFQPVVCESVPIDVSKCIPQENRGHLEKLQDSIKGMMEMLATVKGLALEAAKNPEREGISELGEVITDVLATVPAFEADVFQKLFKDHLQDVLVGVYLADLTRYCINAINFSRAQVEMGEKIHRLKFVA